jgi:membrane-associated HD superfamily phosphohydrolase
MSVSVIKSHVKNGVDLARQEKLPEEVIDIITQHHGNSVISYFYDKAKKLDENTTLEQYSYSGENPTTKEAAVVMLADTVEAACKSMPNHSVPAMRKLVHQLIMDKVEHRLLDNCPLRFCDLTIIEEDFIDTLAGFYHSRIVYPNQLTDEEGETKNSEQSSSAVENKKKVDDEK